MHDLHRVALEELEGLHGLARVSRVWSVRYRSYATSHTMIGMTCPWETCMSRVRGVCASYVTVFACRAYVEATGRFLPEDISYVPRAMPPKSCTSS